MGVETFEIEFYETKGGKAPYEVWYQTLRDIKTKAIILKRLAKVRRGNLGEWASVGEGVKELKIDLGPGYRIYFGEENQKLLILLLGGDKKTQSKDINKAVEYWRDYKSRR